MRIRLIILFFLFAASLRASASHLAIPPDSGCDVITLINGKLIYCKVKSIGLNKVQYSNCRGNSDSIKEIKRTSVFMVNYPGGKTRILTEITNDTLHKPKIKRKVKFVFAINGGISSPIWSYGSHYYLLQADESVYSGFASPGYTYNAIIGLAIKNGWEITVMGNYFHNQFNATELLNENIRVLNDYGNNGPYFIYNPKAVGVYSYNNCAMFFGITKDINIKGPISFGFRFFLGQFWANVPTINGIAYNNPNSTGNMINISLPSANSGRNLGTDIGVRLGVRLLPFLSAFINIDGIFATNTGASEVDYNIPPSTPEIDMLNYYAGVQFDF